MRRRKTTLLSRVRVDILCLLAVLGAYSAVGNGCTAGNAAELGDYLDSYSNTNVAGANGVAFSADGKDVYVSAGNEAISNSVAWFTRDAATGALTYQASATDGSLTHPHGVALSPDGNNVYVAGYYSNVVAWFDRDPSTGALTSGGSAATNCLGAASVAVSPDGKNVYVAAADEDAVTWFSRDPSTGDLTAPSHITSASNLHYPFSVAVSPDGEDVYAAAYLANAVAWFTRDPSDGALTYMGEYTIAGAKSVAISPDGTHVYVAGSDDGSVPGTPDRVAWFTRNPGGDLTLGGSYTDLNIDGADSVAISPDGAHAFVAAWDANAMAWFTLDQVTGALTYGGRYSNANIDQAFAVAVSPDNKHAYVAAYVANTVAWFKAN